MQVTARSYLTAGVALASAGVIAVSPVAPPLPDITIPALRAEAVQLAASPFDIYGEVFQAALDNAGLLVDDYLADPLPILTQILANQVATVNSLVTAGVTAGGDTLEALTTTVPFLLGEAFDDLIGGDVSGAVNSVLLASFAILQPLFGLVEPIGDAIAQPLQNVVNVIRLLTNTEVVSALGLGLLGPVISGVGATGVAIQNVIDALGAGPTALLGALIAGPAVVTDGVLNGGYGPVLRVIPAAFSPLGVDTYVKAGGLLNSVEVENVPGPAAIITSPGTISSLITLDQELGAAITPPTTFASLRTPDAGTYSAAEDPAAVEAEAPAPAPEPEAAAQSQEPTEEAAKTVETNVVRSTGNKVAPGQAAKPGKKLREAAKDVGDQVSSVAKSIGDQVKKALGVGKKQAAKADSTASAG